MIAAGLGFRAGADVAALRSALIAAGVDLARIGCLATVADKAGAGVLLELAAELGVPVRAIPPAEMAVQPVLTQSPRVMALRGTGSVAEAAALAAAGPGARLMGPRAVSACGMATAALAEAGT